MALRARMPESPRWLMLNGRYADTAKAFGLRGMEVSEEEAKQAADELARWSRHGGGKPYGPSASGER